VLYAMLRFPMYRNSAKDLLQRVYAIHIDHRSFQCFCQFIYLVKCRCLFNFYNQ
jgi:hypothetical protein